MIILTDPEGNEIERKSITDAANRLGRNYSSIWRSLEYGYYVTHRDTGIKYKAKLKP